MSRPRIQHVSIPRPPGSADRARAFYTTILQLDEIAPPAALDGLDLVWYRLGDTELHLFAEEPRPDSSGRHLCIEVADLAGARARLEAAGQPIEETIAIPGRPRFFTRDPFGNSLELTTIEAEYLPSQGRDEENRR